MNRPRVKALVPAVLAVLVVGLAVPVEELRGGTWPEEWWSNGAEAMCRLAGELKKLGEAGKDQRIRLAEFLITEDLKDGEAAKRMSPSGGLKHWFMLAMHLGKDITEEKQALWAQRLRAIYATPKDLSARRVDEAHCLGVTLDKLGDVAAFEVVAAWVEGTTAWQSAGGKDLAWLAGDLARSGAAGATARSTLARHLEAKGLTDDWRHVVTLLRNDTAAVRAAWAGKIRAAFVGDSEEFSAMTLKDVRGLVRGLKPLDEAVALSLMVDWIKASTALEPGDLLAVVQDLTGRGDAGGAARQALAQHIETEYLDPAALSSATLADVKGLERVLKEFGQTDTLSFIVAWAENATTLQSADTGALVSLGRRFSKAIEQGAEEITGKSVANVGAALRSMERGRDAASLYETWRKSTESYESLCPEMLRELAVHFQHTGGEGWREQMRLIEHLKAEYLTDPGKIRSVKPHDWYSIGRSLVGVCSQQVRRAWAEKLWQAFSEGEPVPLAMTVRDVEGLVQACRKLDRDLAGRFAGRWLKQTDAWKDFPQNVTYLTYAALGWPSREEGLDLAAILEEIDPLWVAAFEDGRMRGGSVICWTYFWMGNRSKMEQWLQRVREMWLRTDDADEGLYLGRMSEFARLVSARELGLAGPGTGYPDLAVALASRARQGKELPTSWLEIFARSLGTPETRAIVEAELTDSEGIPRLDVAKVLARAYRYVGEFDAWLDLVEQKIAHADTGADAKAVWLLAKADAEALRPSGYDPRRGKQRMDQALATAESPEVQATALAELVHMYMSTMTHEGNGAAAGLLASVREQFSGDARSAITALQQEIQAAEVTLRLKESRRQAILDHARKGGRLRYYQKLLAQAEASGDSEEAASMRAAIQKLEASMCP